MQDGDHLIVYPEVVAGRASLTAQSAVVPRLAGSLAAIRSGRSILSQHQEARGRARGTLETMHQSPRMRRLRNDLTALERLRSESSIFRFSSTGDPPQQYQISFLGKGLCRDDRGRIKVLEVHRVEGSSLARRIREACPSFAG